ncbi:MAG TPA: hypothetical protein VNZ22_08845 [Bacillota bacterium]|nr:hypothetical protein [Bacillota bacterium]
MQHGQRQHVIHIVADVGIEDNFDRSLFRGGASGRCGVSEDQDQSKAAGPEENPESEIRNPKQF